MYPARQHRRALSRYEGEPTKPEIVIEQCVGEKQQKFAVARKSDSLLHRRYTQGRGSINEAEQAPRQAESFDDAAPKSQSKNRLKSATGKPRKASATALVN